MNFNVVVCWKGEAGVLCITLLRRNEGRKLSCHLMESDSFQMAAPSLWPRLLRDIFKGEENVAM